MQQLHILFPDLPESQLTQLARYAELLRDWNRRVNLVSRGEVDRIWPNHLLPSLVILKLLNLPSGSTCADIGTGAGLPGIPVKILRPDLEMVLIDSIRKKILFLKMVIESLQLPRCLAVQHRLDPTDDSLGLRGKFDFVFARAVSSLQTLWPLANPLLKSGGALLAWKGDSDESELRQTAREYGFDYRILKVPPQWHHLSPKFPRLRIFQIFSPARENDSRKE